MHLEYPYDSLSPMNPYISVSGTKNATHNIQQRVFVCATSNLMKNQWFLQGNAVVVLVTSLFLQHQAS